MGAYEKLDLNQLYGPAKIVVLWDWSKFALLPSFPLIRVDSIVDDSWVPRGGSKCYKEVRVANLTVAILLDALESSVILQSILIADKYPHGRVSSSYKLDKTGPDGCMSNTPNYFCGQKGLRVLRRAGAGERVPVYSEPARQSRQLAVAADMVVGVLTHDLIICSWNP